MKAKFHLSRKFGVFSLMLVCAFVLCWDGKTTAQTPNGTDRANAQQMLQNVITDLKYNYFDPDYLKKIALEDRVRQAENDIRKAQSVLQMYGIIGQILVDFDEPGTFFIPPTFVRLPDYGFNWSMVGDQCLVTYVRPGSDAAANGLKAGDQILGFNQNVPHRQNAWKIKNLLFLVRPSQVLSIRIKTTGEEERQLNISMKYANTNKTLTLSNMDSVFKQTEKSLAAIAFKKMIFCRGRFRQPEPIRLANCTMPKSPWGRWRI